MYYHATFGKYVPLILVEGLVPHSDGNDNDNWGWGTEFGDEIFLSDDVDVAASYCEAADNVPDDAYNTGIFIVEVALDEEDVEPDPFVRTPSSFVFHGTVTPDHIVDIYPYKR